MPLNRLTHVGLTGPGVRPACSVRPKKTGFTLVEVLVAMGVFTIVSLGLLSMIIGSRKVSEGNIVQSSATSLLYGVVEQMKTMSDTRLPSTGTADTGFKDYVEVRIGDKSTDTVKLLVSPVATVPADVPPLSTTAADLSAESNVVGPFNMTGIAGSTGRTLSIGLWLWIEKDYQPAGSDKVIRGTLVYTYTYGVGSTSRTTRDMIRFVRARRATVNQNEP